MTSLKSKFEEDKEQWAMTVDQWSDFFQNSKIIFNSIEYSIDRIDLIEEDTFYIQGAKSFFEAVIFSGWSDSVPQTLRSVLSSIEEKMPLVTDDEEFVIRIHDEIEAREVASRPVPNRHGHSSKLQFPGAFGWTQEYQDALPNKACLGDMKQFTESYQEFMKDSRLDRKFVRALADKFWSYPEGCDLFDCGVRAAHPMVFPDHDPIVEDRFGGNVWNRGSGMMRRMVWKHMKPEFKIHLKQNPYVNQSFEKQFGK